MNIIHWLLAGALAIAFILLFWVLTSKPDLTKISCTARGPLFNKSRIGFWRSLQQATGNKRVVLTTVPLPLLVAAKGNNAGAVNDWMAPRWVDFVVVELDSYRPLAVVQLEKTRDNGDSLWELGRDSTLERVLEQAGIPLLWLPSEHYQHVELLQHALDQLLANRDPDPQQ